MQPFAALLLALALASSTIASPIADEAPGPIVIAPSWDNPKAGTTWQIGSRQSVQWNSDNVPPGIKADYVNLLLGYVDTDGNKHMNSGKFHFSRAHTLPLGCNMLLIRAHILLV